MKTGSNNGTQGARRKVRVPFGSETMMRLQPILLTLSIALCALAAHATDVFYSDTHALSENARYKVEAKSPDNKRGNWEKPFARDFAYTLTDLQAKKTLWKRNQGEQEGSCRALYVDNDGWVVIATGWDDLIFVAPTGEDTGTLDILKDAFTADEREQYVHNTTAGPMWAGYSTWYFVRAGQQRLFVIRPWWGRRIISDVEKGAQVPVDDIVEAACHSHEKAFVLRELANGITTRKKWETEDCCDEVWPVLKAAYLAGRLGIEEAVPLLQKLQDSTYSGSSVTGWSAYKPQEGGVDPSDWQEMTMRRVVHLSLRRLGRPPDQYACTTFDVHFEDYRNEHTFNLTPLSHSRVDHASDVKKGMRPEGVLSVIGAPDFNDSDAWHYDMDTDSPFTLTIKWGKTGVADIQRTRPPVWKTNSWDQEIVY